MGGMGIIRILLLLPLMLGAVGCNSPKPSPAQASSFPPGSVIMVVFSDVDEAGHPVTMRMSAVLKKIDSRGVAVIEADKRSGDGRLWFAGKCSVSHISPNGEVLRQDLYDFHFRSHPGSAAPVTGIAGAAAG